MKTSIYTSVSALALMIAAPAMAQSGPPYNGQQSDVAQTGNNNDSVV